MKRSVRLILTLTMVIAIALIGPTPAPTQSQIFSYWIEPSFVRVMQNSSPSSLSGNNINIGAALDEYEGVQLVIKPKVDLYSVSFRIDSLVDKSGRTFSQDAMSIYKVGYVRISNPSSYLGTRVGYYPDPLPPFSSGDLSAGTHPFYLLFHIPRTTAPGSYYGHLIVSSKLAGSDFINNEIININIEVYPFSIGKHFDCRMGLSSPDLIAQAEKIPDLYDSSGMGKAVISRYTKLLTDHNISPFGCWPALGFKNSNGSWDFYRRFSSYGMYPEETPDKYFHLYLEQYGSRGYRLPMFYSEGSWNPGAPGSSIAKNRLISLLKYFKFHDFYDRLFAYPIDEPREDAASIARVINYVKWMDGVTSSLRYPSMPFLLTEEPTQKASSLFPYVDIWVPVVHRFYYNKSYINKVRSMGKKIWWYTNAGSAQGYGPTFLIDDPAPEARIFTWMAYKEKVTGMIYFNTARWLTPSTGSSRAKKYRNPWLDPLSFRFKNNGYYRYANGEGEMIYPGSYVGHSGYDAVPVGSLRLERIRDGIEDYEYLHYLESLGEGAYVRSLLDTLVPFRYGQYNPSDYKNFPDVNYSATLFNGVRERIVHMILAKKAVHSPATVKGKVLSSGRPVKNATVTDGVLKTKTNKYGSYVLRGVLPGRISISISHPEFNGQSKVVSTGDNESSIQNYSVTRKGNRILHSFEGSVEGWWSITGVRLLRSSFASSSGGTFPTDRSRSMKVIFPKSSSPYASVRNEFKYWSGYRSLEFDVFNPSAPNLNAPWMLNLSLVDAGGHRAKYYFLLPKGYFHVECDLRLKPAGFNLRNVTKMVMGLNNAGSRTIYFDNFRLIK